MIRRAAPALCWLRARHPSSVMAETDAASLSMVQEKSVEAWTLARINMLLNGLPGARIDKGDTLRDPRFAR